MFDVPNRGATRRHDWTFHFNADDVMHAAEKQSKRHADLVDFWKERQKKGELTVSERAECLHAIDVHSAASAEYDHWAMLLETYGGMLALTFDDWLFFFEPIEDD